MKVSIITATYNSGKTLQETIDSVLGQSYPDIEYIVIDGQSSDNTLNIIEKNMPLFNGRMKWISEPDQGIYDAMNKGIRLATGDIIGIINSDDTFSEKEIITEVVTRFKETGCEVLYGDLIYQNNEKNIRYWKSNPFRYSGLYFGWMPPHPTLYCKKEIYEKYGVFDSKFRISADYEFILRIFKNKKMKSEYLSKVMVLMNMGGASNGSVGNISQKMMEDFAALQKNKIALLPVTLFFKNLRKFYQFFRVKLVKPEN